MSDAFPHELRSFTRPKLTGALLHQKACDWLSRCIKPDDLVCSSHDSRGVQSNIKHPQILHCCCMNHKRDPLAGLYPPVTRLRKVAMCAIALEEVTFCSLVERSPPYRKSYTRRLDRFTSCSATGGVRRPRVDLLPTTPYSPYNSNHATSGKAGHPLKGAPLHLAAKPLRSFCVRKVFG